MLIRTLTRAAGRLTWAPGQIIEIDAGDARELIAAGAAVAADTKHKEPAPTEPPVPLQLPELNHQVGYLNHQPGYIAGADAQAPVRRGRGRPPKIRE